MMTIKEYINEYHAHLNECRKKLKKLNDEFCKSNVKFVKVGDVIAVKDTSKSTDEFKTLVESNASRTVPKWIDADSAAMTAKVVAVPEREEIATPVEEHLIVEFYSK